MIINGHYKTNNGTLIVIKKISALAVQKQANKETGQDEYMYYAMLDNGNTLAISHQDYMALTKFMTQRM